MKLLFTKLWISMSIPVRLMMAMAVTLVVVDLLPQSQEFKDRPSQVIQKGEACDLLLVEYEGGVVPIITSHIPGSSIAVVRIFYLDMVAVKSYQGTETARIQLMLSKVSLAECAFEGVQCMGDPVDIAITDVVKVRVKILGQLGEEEFMAATTDGGVE